MHILFILRMCLQELLKQTKIQNSELFGAFLMGSSDSSLFSPESMGGKYLCVHMCVFMCVATI